jgi:hypothetical protein
VGLSVLRAIAALGHDINTTVGPVHPGKGRATVTRLEE